MGWRTLRCTTECQGRPRGHRYDFGIDQMAKLKSYSTGKKPNWVEFVTLP
ncbi:hypothetical protein [Bradyrhizobium japonicum]|nr:hypothetical protein [Bradyrhizobium japonicum]